MFKLNSVILLGLGLAVAACENDSRDPTAPEIELGSVESAASIVNSWATKSSILTTRNFGVAGSQNQVIYFVGGRDAGGQSTKTVQAYSLASNTWSFKADLPQNRRAANGATFVSGKLYVSGGFSNTGGTHKTLYVYNPGTNTWTQKKSMPNTGSCGAQGAIGGKLYVYTPGVGSCGTTHRFYRYNPNNDSWTTLPNPPSVHSTPVAGVIDGKFYLAGGSSNGSLTPNLALHVYNPATNSWSTKASLPSKQQYAAGAVVSGKLYIAGGANFDMLGVPAYWTVRAYDPATNTWSARAAMLTPRYYAAGVNAGSKLWVISGWGAGNSSKVEVYTP